MLLPPNRFDELAGLLDPGAPKSDKGSIVSEATRQLRELRREVESARQEKARLEAANDALRRENESLRNSIRAAPSADEQSCQRYHEHQVHHAAPQQQAPMHSISPLALSALGLAPPPQSGAASASNIALDQSQLMQNAQQPPEQQQRPQQWAANLAQQVAAGIATGDPDALTKTLLAQQRGDASPGWQQQEAVNAAPAKVSGNEELDSNIAQQTDTHTETQKYQLNKATQPVQQADAWNQLQQVMQNQLWTDPEEDARRRPPAA